MDMGDSSIGRRLRGDVVGQDGKVENHQGGRWNWKIALQVIVY